MASSCPFARESCAASFSLPSIAKAAGQNKIQVTASSVLSLLYSLSTAAAKAGVASLMAFASARSSLHDRPRYIEGETNSGATSEEVFALLHADTTSTDDTSKTRPTSLNKTLTFPSSITFQRSQTLIDLTSQHQKPSQVVLSKYITIIKRYRSTYTLPNKAFGIAPPCANHQTMKQNCRRRML